MRPWWSVVAALAAALSFAVAAVLQQESAQAEPEEESLRIRLLLSLLRRPKWVVGVAMLLCGYGLQGLALALGPVALVQPIIVTELAFAIPLAMWRKHHRAGAREWVGIAMVLTGIATFLVVASPKAGTSTPNPVEWAASLIPVGAVIFVAVSVATRVRGPARTMLLGAAAGLAFAVLAVLTKSLTHVIAHDSGRLLLSWQLYAVIGIGIGALVISQSAYQSGPLAYSMPFVSVLEPAVAVVIGDTVLNEQVQLSAGFLALQAIAALVAVGGIVALTTSPLVHSIYADARSEGGSGGSDSPGARDD